MTLRTRSSTRWSTSTSTRRSSAAAGEPNTFCEPVFVGRGVRDLQYSHAFVSLHDDDALVVEIDPSDVSMWDVMLYNRAWYEALDAANRVTSLNHRQVHRDADGKVRVVVANIDPGVANWLDTEGRARGARHDPVVPAARAAECALGARSAR